jgi:hypothetical protein
MIKSITRKTNYEEQKAEKKTLMWQDKTATEMEELFA